MTDWNTLRARFPDDEFEEIDRIKQWNVKERYYKNKDFDETVLQKYFDNLKNDIIKNYLNQNPKKIKLIDL